MICALPPAVLHLIAVTLIMQCFSFLFLSAYVTVVFISAELQPPLVCAIFPRRITCFLATDLDLDLDILSLNPLNSNTPQQQSKCPHFTSEMHAGSHTMYKNTHIYTGLCSYRYISKDFYAEFTIFASSQHRFLNLVFNLKSSGK